LRLLNLLLGRVESASPEGRGFARLEDILRLFADVFGDASDVIWNANRLLARQLVEVDTRSTLSIENASYIRVTSGGWYYAKFLTKAFAYLDLVLEDTSFANHVIVDQLAEDCAAVDAVPTDAYHKLEKIELRFTRVDRFLQYLQESEQRERDEYSLHGSAGILSQEIVRPVREQYEREKAFTRRRLAANAENRPDTEVGPVSREADRELAGILSSVEDQEVAPVIAYGDSERAANSKLNTGPNPSVAGNG
jgi:hypothetical protein